MKEANGICESPSTQGHSPDLEAKSNVAIAVLGSLAILRPLSALLDVYGAEENASDLRRAIGMLETIAPDDKEDGARLDFVVNAKYSIRRKRVADLLQLGYDSSSWCRVVGTAQPRELLFRCEHERIVERLDYPLNIGGSLTVSTIEKESAVFLLDLGTIANGLDTLASKYPRHFADFLNAKEDGITGSIFLQCCVFGEIIFE